jgi:hypothetical protein
MQGDKTPLRVEGFEVEEMDGEAVLYHPASDKVLHLNPSAALIWTLCTGRHTAAELAETLCAVYPQSAAEIKKDVSRALEELFAAGAIQWA